MAFPPSRTKTPGRTGRPERRPRPPPNTITEHGIIGDRHTAALVGLDGTIDWYCTPHFDSPSVFGALLDPKGGHFRIWIDRDDVNTRQQYLPSTNVLLTRFMSRGGVAELLDFMPLDHDRSTPPLHRIVRCLRVLRGSLAFRLDCQPAFDHGRTRHETRVAGKRARFRSDNLGLELNGPVPLQAHAWGVGARFLLKERESATFVLRTLVPGERRPSSVPHQDPQRMLNETIRYWRRWSSRCNYHGRWREQVLRSALALKLLTFEPTGAIVAAPTTSLPERIGGPRNWDYRYGWLRDSSFVVHALLRIGFAQEASDFIEWLLHCIENSDPDQALMPLYTVDAKPVPAEKVLAGLEGYAGSRPVRIGNGAGRHLQLDLYGAVFDALYAYERGGARISHELWTRLVHLLDWLCENWTTPDRGIWEIRSEPRHHTFSKLMCWVALDRGLRIARARGLPANRTRWARVRDEIYDTIMTRGWNPKRRAFVGSLDGDDLDASLLLMPTLGFVAPSDPRMRSTIRAVQDHLGHGYLVRRYDRAEVDDGVPGTEGSFSLCGFFLVEALTRAGQVDEARLAFETLLGFGNHLGLCGEQISDSGAVVGNFPQALTHLALIRAAVDLDQALGRGA